MKVRKRPVVVGAYQIKDEYFLLNAPDWVLKACSDNTVFGYFSDNKEGVRIKTLEGDMFAPFGYYLIRGVEGELYGCDPNVFKKTYDIVERRSGMSKKYNAERLAEHNEDEEHLEYHTKDSLINLYRDLLNLTNELMREVTE